MNKWLHLGLTIAGTVVPAVAQVERLAHEQPTLRGRAKQDAAMEILAQVLQQGDGVVLEDPESQHATRALIDATVALQNVIARTHGA